MTVHERRLATIADEERPGGDPPYLFPDYRSTVLRGPKEPLLILPHTLSETTGPAFGEGTVDELDHDLTRQHAGEPLGERIIVTGRVLDADGRPIREHARRGLAGERRRPLRAQVDQHPAPLDPNFTGAGRCLTDDDGRYASSRQAGRLPVGEPPQRLAARAHPLLALRPRVHRPAGHADVLPGRPAVRVRPDLPLRARPEGARRCSSAASTWETTTPDWALGYRFDIVLGGRRHDAGGGPIDARR